MSRYSEEQIRHLFSASASFNELTEALEEALAQNIGDLNFYMQLIHNHNLPPDERSLFGEKIAKERPEWRYDIFMALAKLFELTSYTSDNYERAMRYYRKAAGERPAETEPYMHAARCYNPIVTIPPFEELVRFVKEGVIHAHGKKELLYEIASLYEARGDQAQAHFYRDLADRNFLVDN